MFEEWYRIQKTKKISQIMDTHSTYQGQEVNISSQVLRITTPPQVASIYQPYSSYQS